MRVCVCVAGSVGEQSGSVCAADRLGELKTTPSPPAAQPGKPDPEKKNKKNLQHSQPASPPQQKTVTKLSNFVLTVTFFQDRDQTKIRLYFSHRAGGEVQIVPERGTAAAS